MSGQSPSPPATPPSKDSSSAVPASRRHRRAETIGVPIKSKGNDFQNPTTGSPHVDLEGPQILEKVQFQEPDRAAASPKDERPSKAPESTGGGPKHPTPASPEPRPPKSHQNNSKETGVQNIDHAESDGQSCKMTTENIEGVGRECDAQRQVSENI
ncbi:MAG: hypothetical protein Q9165_001500 [Trypethelium subeluteriae]